MAKLYHPLILINQEFDTGERQLEALHFPEMMTFGRNVKSIRLRLVRHVIKLLKEIPALELHGRRLIGTPRVELTRVSVSPPKQDVAWRQPVELEFPCVVWSHGDSHVVANVPGLDINVLAANDEELRIQLPRQIRAELLRRGQVSLRSLVLMARPSVTKLDRVKLSLKRPSLIDQARQEERAAKKTKSVLKQVATELIPRELSPAFVVESWVGQLAEHLTARESRSVLLVGPSGVGKTAIVHELVRQRESYHLGHTPFWSTSGSRLIAGASGFGMWQQRCQELIHELAKTKAVLHVGSLYELKEVGKGGGSSQGIASFLRPAIQRGTVLLIAECTPEQLPVLEREEPQLLAAFQALTINEPDESHLRTILREVAARTTAAKAMSGTDHPLTGEALEQLELLHQRYTTYSARPGRPLRFLENLLRDHQHGEPVTASEVITAFSRETGLPRFMLDPHSALQAPTLAGGSRPPSAPIGPSISDRRESDGGSELASVHNWFERRIMGQPGAVSLVVDLLTTLKAGMTRMGRPIASLLFIGPTGVGKTEMAKALCEFLYQDINRMVRFDLSEYADAPAITRLIQGTSNSEGLLTTKVRQQPFTVVLLDELEKAHASFFDLLLQILGEGRLTDAAGRRADFSNCVIVMSSILGSDSYGRDVSGFAGTAGMAARASDHFARRVSEFFRPELFNRLDRIVPFQPLHRDTIAAIAAREVKSLLGRDGLRFRQAACDIEPAVTERLATDGYHVRYGARPLKRAMERELVAPLAEQLNQYQAELPLELSVELDANGQRILCRARPGQSTAAAPVGDETAAALEKAIELRRLVQSLDRAPSTLRLRNEAFRLAEQLKRRKRRKDEPYRYDPLEQPLRALREALERIDQTVQAAIDLEEQFLVAWHRRLPLDPSLIESQVSAQRAALHHLLLDLYRRESGPTETATLCLYSEESRWMTALAHAYEQIARTNRLHVTRYHLTPYHPELDPNVERKPSGSPGGSSGSTLRPSYQLSHRKESSSERADKTLDVYLVADSGRFSQLPAGAVGMAIQLRGEGAFLLVAGEQGVHEFQQDQRASRCFVEVTSGPISDYEPPRNIHRRNTIPAQPRRRRYAVEEKIVSDARLSFDFPWNGDDLIPLVPELAEQYIFQQAWQVLT